VNQRTEEKESTGMQQDNLSVVRGVYDAFARGDVQAIFGLVHPEAEVYQSSRLPWGGEYRGHEGLGAFLTKLTETVESQVEPELLIDDEEGHVVQVGRTRGRVRVTGNEFDVSETHVWTVEEGKVIRFDSYIDTPKMREALGLQTDVGATAR
jgi:ketosteroid isomerase-like protein